MKNDKYFPKISVILPVYNEEKYLDESIQSILNQIFKDFEFIIINDCSKDNSKNIIEKYKKRDKRIIFINNNKNMGCSESLNIGLKKAGGKYIACFCADDISAKQRLEIQYNYLENNQNIFLVGTSAIYINENGKEIRRFRKYNDYKMLAWRLRRSCGLIFPSIMFRNGGGNFFDKNFGGATDYDFFLNLLRKGKNLTNLPQFLIKYRVHKGAMSVYNKKEQEFLANKTKNLHKDIDNKVCLFDKLYYSIKLFFHYLKTMKEKKII